MRVAAKQQKFGPGRFFLTGPVLKNSVRNADQKHSIEDGLPIE